MSLVRITDAAARLGTTARMLRYRERLGLLAPAADEPGRHRRYGAADLEAAAGCAARGVSISILSPKIYVT